MRNNQEISADETNRALSQFEVFGVLLILIIGLPVLGKAALQHEIVDQNGFEVVLWIAAAVLTGTIAAFMSRE
jgi:hypothetical protein